MKVFLDACVLYPSVMRSLLLGAADAGLYQPFWSDRVLEEWALAAARHGQEAIARTDIALVRLRWPDAEVAPRARDESRLVLPDENDVHVLASAIAASAEILVTLNAKDFPRHTLNAEGLSRQDPDAFLHALWVEAPDRMIDVATNVHETSLRDFGTDLGLAAMVKKARLPRFAKALRQLD